MASRLPHDLLTHAAASSAGLGSRRVGSLPRRQMPQAPRSSSCQWPGQQCLQKDQTETKWVTVKGYNTPGWVCLPPKKNKPSSSGWQARPQGAAIYFAYRLPVRGRQGAEAHTEATAQGLAAWTEGLPQTAPTTAHALTPSHSFTSHQGVYPPRSGAPTLCGVLRLAWS